MERKNRAYSALHSVSRQPIQKREKARAREREYYTVELRPSARQRCRPRAFERQNILSRERKGPFVPRVEHTTGRERARRRGWREDPPVLSNVSKPRRFSFLRAFFSIAADAAAAEAAPRLYQSRHYALPSHETF